MFPIRSNPLQRQTPLLNLLPPIIAAAHGHCAALANGRERVRILCPDAFRPYDGAGNLLCVQAGLGFA